MGLYLDYMGCVSLGNGKDYYSRYEKFSYQGYHLFMLKKVIREIAGTKSFSPEVAK